jgi:hypothetical protein
MMVEYEVILNFKSTFDGKATQNLIPSKVTNNTKKTVSSIDNSFSQLGSLTIKKGTIFDAETYSKINQSMKEMVKPVRDITGVSGLGLNFSKGMDMVNTSTAQTSVSLNQMQKTFGQLMQVERFRAMGMDAKFLNSELASIAMTSGLAPKEFDAMANSAKKMSQGFDMNAMSVMFFGMAVQKFFLGTFNQMLNAFKMLDKKGIMPLNRALTRMEASWTFLSFSIMKAMEPMLLPFIDGLVSMVDWFANLDPLILRVVGSLTALLGILGGIAFLFGTLKLGIGGISGLGIGTALESVLGKGAVGAAGALGKGALELAIGVSFFLVGADIFKNGIKAIFDGIDKGDLGLAATGAGIALGGILLTAFGGILIIDMATKVGVALGLISANTTVLASATAVGTSISGSIVGGITSFLAGGTAVALIGASITALAVALAAVFIYGFQDALAKNSDQLLAKEMGEEAYQNYKAGISDAIDKYGTADLKVGLNYGAGLNLQTSEEVTQMFSDFNSSIVEQAPAVTTAMNTTIEQPLSTAIINITDVSGIGGATMVTNFADQVTATTPYLIDSITVAFTSATNVMESIVHTSVEKVIADVNRALAKIRELENKNKSATTSNTTVNNNQKVSITSNNSNAISKALTNAKIAVPGS